MNARSQFLFAASASVLVIAAVIAGLVVNGSPNTVRAQKLDAQRIADMERISSSVSGYWKERNSLPEALRDLQKADPYIRMSDVETGSAYEYRKTGPMSYELCARFDAARHCRQAHCAGDRAWCDRTQYSRMG